MAFRSDPYQNIVNVGWGGEDFFAAIHFSYSVSDGNYTTGALQGLFRVSTEQFKLVDEEWVTSGETPISLNYVHEGSQPGQERFHFPPSGEDEPYSEAFNIVNSFDREDVKFERANGRRILLEAGGHQLQGVVVSVRVAFWRSPEALDNNEQVNSFVGSFTVTLTGLEMGEEEEQVIVEPKLWIEFDFSADDPAVTIFPFTP